MLGSVRGDTCHPLLHHHHGRGHAGRKGRAGQAGGPWRGGAAPGNGERGQRAGKGTACHPTAGPQLGHHEDLPWSWLFQAGAAGILAHTHQPDDFLGANLKQG